MLAMRRESGQYVVIGTDIIVQVVDVGGQIRLAIDAPKDVRIERGEVYERTNPTPDCIRRLAAREDAPKSYRFQTPGV